MRLFLIRHGEPLEQWGDAVDPGLSETGWAQAERAARALAARPVTRIVCSPMLRCRETAAPFAAVSNLSVEIEPRVSEVATPPGLTDRRAWLNATFPWRAGAQVSYWRDMDEILRTWRQGILEALRACEGDTCVFTHFIALNAIVGAATGREETIVCRPALASITEVNIDASGLSLISLGAEMETGEVR